MPPLTMQRRKVTAALAALAALLAVPPSMAAWGDTPRTPKPETAARPWQRQASGTENQLRGLSVVSPTVAWASGAKGTVLRTVDGRTWKRFTVPGAEALDLRDIHAFDADTAVALSIGPGDASRIYRTADGGASWALQVTNPDANGFWDCLAFWDRDNGIVFGDPVDGAYQILTTGDGGATWQAAVDPDGLKALPNEAAFAASGTCLSVAGTDDAWFATGGGARARVFHSADRGRTWQASDTPIPAGAGAKGVFSVGFRDSQVGLAVGGDYSDRHLATLNGARSEDGGATWAPQQVLPVGYMSVVVPVTGAPDSFVAAGLAGSGYSLDAGRTWKVLDRTPVNTVGFASPTAGWAVGPKGLILKYAGPQLGK
ncbi:oxidoreductase [Pseudoduganella buxea]|uniref:Oxidoreductase n=3 Tax=Pseudoduganella buxea TaxID=1949069 RepID=A0ABQ1JZY2_9BURK|nr:oxidoreductase [Pseudoduganella buxea]